MYVFLSGYPPFPGNNNDEIFRSINRGTFDFHQKEWNNVSNEAKNLIKRILKINPKDRPSLEEILEDKWFKIKATEKIEIDSEVLSRLRKTKNENKFKTL